MLTQSINLINFKKKKSLIKIHKNLKLIIKDSSQVIESLKSTYKNNFKKKKFSKIQKIFKF